ncbi:FimV/HubP family polar landmark protein [Vreelandella stevensii]|uniref:type IV pilus assembly protein FimV n=1 Tax=Vreelandella stevensii TaxID=502821 RepID=UPI00374A7070
MKNKLAWLSWLPLGAVSPLALAVGLGQVTVNSPLQAPLNASAPIVDVSEAALDELRVEVADEAAFTAQGLEWTPLAASVRAEIERLPGGARVVLRTDQEVLEPWLDLLLTISGPDGRSAEAFTLLFDLPESAASAPVAAPASHVSPSATAAQAPPQAVSSSPSPASVASAAQAPGGTAYVASGDSLWGVAARVKPAEVSVQQMMLALVEANPSAFPSGNPDELRAGQTLVVPGREQIMARSPSQASQAVQAMRQTAAAPASAATPAASEPEATAAAPSSGEEPVLADEALAASEQLPQSAPEGPLAEGNAEGDTEGETESELAGLTLNDLAEQLRESQAMLQTVLEERDLMRAEMAALRQEVASLTEALQASQLETQRALAAAEAMAASAGQAAGARASGPGVIARLEAYQWPLASAALALLLGALVWSRKRRERQWEDVPAPAAAVETPPQRAEPVMESTGTAGAPLAEPPLAEPPPFDIPKAPEVAERYEHVSAADEPVTDESAVQEPVAQASGEHGPLEEPSSQASSPEWSSTEEEVESAVDEDEAALEAAFLATPEPVEEPEPRSPLALEEPTLVESTPAEAKPNEPEAAQELEEATEPSAPQAPAQSVPEDHRAHYIDYHPPSLQANEPDDAETSLSGKTDASPLRTRYTTEEEWEIEEVAFEPRRRDNSDSSKSSK